MNEKLAIRKFGDIENRELSLASINLLTGPDVYGKLVCTRTLYFFKQFTSEMMTCIEKELTLEEFEQYLVNGFESLFSKSMIENVELDLHYELDGFYVTLSRSNTVDKPVIQYSDVFKSLYTQGQTLFRDKVKSFPTQLDLYMQEIQKVFEKEFGEILSNALSPGWSNHQLYIPAERAIYANVPRAALNLLWQDKDMDPILIAFGEIYEKFKLLHFYLTKKGVDLKRSSIDMQDFLGGSYVREQESDFIIRDGGKKTNIMRALPEDKALLPLLVILCNLPAHQYGNEGKTVYIDSPEVFLSPDKQLELVNLVVRLRQIRSDLQFVLTTEGPSILNAFKILTEPETTAKVNNKKIVIKELMK